MLRSAINQTKWANMATGRICLFVFRWNRLIDLKHSQPKNATINQIYF